MDQPRTIERSRDDRVLFGVCGGIARAFDLDPTIVRVIGVVLIALGGLGLVAYVVAALLLPEEGGGRPILDLGIGQRDRKTTTVALLVLAVVVLIVAGDPFPNADRGGLIVLVAAVVA
ncbi:MAG TPA: PspC domain-containing protein, partial [Naasia sp.]